MKLAEHKNSKKQGDAGLGAAIGYFTANGYNVSLPLTDSQEYDLVIEEDNVLKKVQVKTSRYKSKYGIPLVGLRTMGGNKSGQSIKKFDSASVDYLFIVTDENQYLIPSNKVKGKSGIALGDDYSAYLV